MLPEIKKKIKNRSITYITKEKSNEILNMLKNKVDSRFKKRCLRVKIQIKKICVFPFLDKNFDQFNKENS